MDLSEAHMHAATPTCCQLVLTLLFVSKVLVYCEERSLMTEPAAMTAATIKSVRIGVYHRLVFCCDVLNGSG